MQMHPLGILAIGLLACAPASAGTTASPSHRLDALVGTDHPPRPDGVVERASLLIDDSTPGRWVVAELVVDGTRGVALEMVLPDGPAGTRWRTVAMQRVASDTGRTLYLGTCSRAGQVDRAVVAIGGPDRVRDAWRADTARRRFERIEASTVTCREMTDG